MKNKNLYADNKQETLDDQYIVINTQKINYEIFRQKRKTIALSFAEDGKLVIKMPLNCSIDKAFEFADVKKKWILEHFTRIQKRNENKMILTETEYKQYLNKAADVLYDKVQYYSKIIGVTFNHVTIRNQKTRWGSCSSKGNINLNWKLILMPEEIQDYVVIHELCHLLEMNHSTRFWNQVEQYCMNYRECKKWLRENAPEVEINK